ncbi:MAG TPA: alpha/beta fold hydrolase [Glaciibacter sp.]|nr:alpha/beta fold hydrolase [Glaciibacter sp.]
MLHGRGGNETDLEWLADKIPSPWSPHLLRAPLSLGAGFEWFRAPEGSLGLMCSDVRPAADSVLRWIDQNAADRRVAVLGYSQGGAVALQVLRRAPERVEFVVTLAGFTTTDTETGDAELARRRPPVFWGRGARDTVIPDTDIARMREFLPEHVALEERVYAHADHWISVEMAADAQRFIRLSRDRSMQATDPLDR